MAKAGFYMTSDKSDDVRCYFCLKELNEWSPEDDPWKEHLSHNSECLFAQLATEEKELTFAQFGQLRLERLTNLWVGTNLGQRKSSEKLIFSFCFFQAKRREYFLSQEKAILKKYGLDGIGDVTGEDGKK